MRILISGAGIAGPTLAYWLAQYGFKTTIVEKAPKLRTGGYIIDFWGAGFDVADRMGLMPELNREGYVVQDVKVVNRNGRRIAGFPAKAFARATRGRYVSLPRGDLAASIFGKIEDKVEAIFGDGIDRIEQTAEGVDVTFGSGGVRTFDLVIGADGLHSRVRELVFGAQGRFEKYLGYKAAAFEAEGYRPRGELTYVMYTQVGQQVARFAMCGDRTMFFITFADEVAIEGSILPGKRLCCESDSETAGGNVRRYWRRSIQATTSISIASANTNGSAGRTVDKGTGYVGWRCGVLRLAAGRARLCVSHGGGVYSCRGTSPDSRRLRGSIPALPGAVWAVHSTETKSGSTACGNVCTEVRVCNVFAQPDHEPDENRLGGGSGYGA